MLFPYSALICTLRDVLNLAACPRESYRLWKKIKKMESDHEIKGEHEIKAQVVNWSSVFDILDFLKSLN